MKDLFGNEVGPPDLSISDRVKWVLETYPETRDSEAALLIRFWISFCNLGDYLSLNSIYALEKYLSLPSVISPETISRRRREIQYDAGEFKASANVESHRLQRAMNGPPKI